MDDVISVVLERRETAPIANQGIILIAVSWAWLSVAICSLIARFAVKMSIKTPGRRYGMDDLFIIFAAVFSVAQTVTVSIEPVKVLGRHEQDIAADQIDAFQKAGYAVGMLYIANMGCARISVCLLIRKVLPGIIPKFTTLVFAAFTALWSISGVLTLAFTCDLPKPWDFKKDSGCIDTLAFVDYIAITNIVVEVILVAIPLVVWNVRMPAGNRASISGVFLARLSVVAAVSAHLYFLNLPGMADYTFNSWSSMLCQQIAQNLAIITACLPCLHPFIKSILAGTTIPEAIEFRREAPLFIKQYLGYKATDFDPNSSQASQNSTLPFSEKSAQTYCRPLATHGLIRSSAHIRTSSVSRFSSPVSDHQSTERPDENVFNRPMEMPISRPETSSSARDPLSAPRILDSVGVLPTIEWDTDGSDSTDSRHSPTRQPTAEYIFNREKVVSVPEESVLYEEGDRKFAPLPSPSRTGSPPRAF